MKKLNSIQYLRGLAALLVVACHGFKLRSNFEPVPHPKLGYFETFGAIGVDIFFVISGFIISYISTNQTGSNASIDFMKRRLTRVVPIYYVASLLMFFIGFFQKIFSIPIVGIIKTITILPIFDPPKNFWVPLIIPGWTLGFELFFYILFACLICFPIKKKDMALLISIMVLVTIGKLFPVKDSVQWALLTNPICLEFCLGVLIAMLYKSSIKVPALISLISIIAALAAMVLLIKFGFGDLSESEPTIWGVNSMQRVLLWGFPSALLVFGCVFFEKTSMRKWFGNKVLLMLGKASYSIYLVHITTFIYLISISKRIPILPSFIKGDLLIYTYMLVAILVGCMFHFFIEKPLLKKLNIR